MKKQLEHLQILLLTFHAEWFYDINVDEFNIALQGKYNKTVFDKAISEGFVVDKTDHSFTRLTKGSDRIVLTS